MPVVNQGVLAVIWVSNIDSLTIGGKWTGSRVIQKVALVILDIQGCEENEEFRMTSRVLLEQVGRY